MVGPWLEDQMCELSREIRGPEPPNKIQTRTSEMRFPAIWTSILVCSFANFVVFGNRTAQMLHAWKIGHMPPPAPWFLFELVISRKYAIRCLPVMQLN